MNIIFFAGSVRPGGGLTVARIMIVSLAEDPGNNIVVYTGAQDSSEQLSDVFDKFQNVTEKKFLPGVKSEIRYLISKLYFIPSSLLKRNTVFISINYFIPSFSKLFVYHINLLSFMIGGTDSLGMRVKRFDAKLACKYANINVFESLYLKNVAKQYTGAKISNPTTLYIGIDPIFNVQPINESIEANKKCNILVVSSMQPHKDNQTCIKSLVRLIQLRANIPWTLTIVGGQSVEQWLPLKDYSESLGISDEVKFLGPLSKINLSKLMSESLCLISGSRVESFCMVALEAMASGCPVIVTNETSMPESVGDSGLLVSAGNVNEFVSRIIYLYDNKDFRLKLIEKGIYHSRLFSSASFKRNLKEIVQQ